MSLWNRTQQGSRSFELRQEILVLFIRPTIEAACDRRHLSRPPPSPLHTPRSERDKIFFCLLGSFAGGRTRTRSAIRLRSHFDDCVLIWNPFLRLNQICCSKHRLDRCCLMMPRERSRGNKKRRAHPSIFYCELSCTKLVTQRRR